MGMWGKKSDQSLQTRQPITQTDPVRIEIGKGKAEQLPVRENKSVVWSPPTSPKEKKRRLEYRADCLHHRIVRRGELEAEIFIQNGIDLFNFKRYGLWAWVQGNGGKETSYTSFDAYVADPDNHITDTTAHLGVQVVTLFLYYLRFPWLDMRAIGQKKLMVITPYLQSKLLDRICVIKSEPYEVVTEDGEIATREKLVEYNLYDLDPKRWKRYREIAEYWVARAQTLSYTALVDLLGREKGWNSLYHSPVTMGKLRSFEKVSDLLAFFGLSDLPDSEVIYPNLRQKLMNPKAEK